MPVFNKPDVNKPFASGGSRVAPSETKIAQGWVEEIPPMEWQNFLQNRNDQFLAHINQRGIPMWDSVTEYQAQASYVMASNGVIYRAKQTNTNVNPLLDTTNTYWEIPFEQRGAAAAVQTALNTHVTNYGTLAGLTNISTARSNLGLGSAATRNVGTNSGNLLEVGAFGLGDQQALSDPDITTNGFRTFRSYGAKNPTSNHLYNILHIGSDAAVSQIASSPQVGPTQIFVRTRNNVTGVWSSWTKLSTAADLTGFGATLVQQSNASQARSVLGLGNAATYNAGSSAGTVLLSQTFIDQALKRSQNLNDLPNKASARAALQLGTASLKNVVNVPGNLDFSWSVNQNGYQRLPSGLIFQWGRAALSVTGTTVTLPVAYPNACIAAFATDNFNTYEFDGPTVAILSRTQIRTYSTNTGDGRGSGFTAWFTIGY